MFGEGVNIGDDLSFGSTDVASGNGGSGECDRPFWVRSYGDGDRDAVASLESNMDRQQRIWSKFKLGLLVVERGHASPLLAIGHDAMGGEVVIWTAGDPASDGGQRPRTTLGSGGSIVVAGVGDEAKSRQMFCRLAGNDD